MYNKHVCVYFEMNLMELLICSQGVQPPRNRNIPEFIILNPTIQVLSNSSMVIRFEVKVNICVTWWALFKDGIKGCDERGGWKAA